MKRLLLLLVLFFLTFTCFAQWKSLRDSEEYGMGLPFFTENTNYIAGLNPETRTNIVSYSFNMAGKSLYTERWGIGSYGNFIFPQTLNMSENGQEISVDMTPIDFFFGFDLLMGPMFMLFRNEIFALPVTMGLYYFQLYVWDTDDPRLMMSRGSFGLGANVTAEYHVNDNVYIYARFQYNVNFFSLIKITENFPAADREGALIIQGFNPSLGFGFKR